MERFEYIIYDSVYIYLLVGSSGIESEIMSGEQRKTQPFEREPSYPLENTASNVATSSAVNPAVTLSETATNNTKDVSNDSCQSKDHSLKAIREEQCLVAGNACNESPSSIQGTSNDPSCKFPIQSNKRKEASWHEREAM